MTIKIVLCVCVCVSYDYSNYNNSKLEKGIIIISLSFMSKYLTR